MTNKLLAISVCVALLSPLGACKKSTKSVQSMYEAKDTDGLSAFIEKPSNDLSALAEATLSLVKMGRVVRALKSFSTLNSLNAPKAKALLAAIFPKLKAMLSQAPTEVQAKDALVAFATFMEPHMEREAATVVFAWFGAGMEVRIEKGDYKFRRSLEMLWTKLPTAQQTAAATAHAAWVLTDVKGRAKEIELLYELAGRHRKFTRLTKRQQVYSSYYDNFRTALVKRVTDNYSTTKASQDQLTDLSLINQYGTPEEKKKAGAQILAVCNKTGQFKLVSIKALGDLRPAGATSFLANFVKPNANIKVRLAAHEALAVITDDPKAMELLYNEFKPFLLDLKSQRPSTEQVARVAKSAAKGLFYNRSCALAGSEFDLIRTIYTMPLKSDLFEARDSVKPILYRLLLCTGQEKGLKLLLDGIKNPMNFKYLTKIVDSFGAMDKKILLPILRKNATSKKIEVVIPAIWGLSGFGEAPDVALLKPHLLDGRPIPKWGKTVGEFTTEVAKNMEQRLKKKK